MAVAGRGARDPVGNNANDAGRASNRRVEILVGERK
jgi:flagellar motor protein MotB